MSMLIGQSLLAITKSELQQNHDLVQDKIGQLSQTSN